MHHNLKHISKIKTKKRVFLENERAFPKQLIIQRVSFVRKRNGVAKAAIFKKRYNTMRKRIFDEVYVYFPITKKDASKFYNNSIVNSKVHGPGDTYPGAVGVIELRFEHDVLTFGYVQGAFVHKPGGTLTRGIISKHGGWRQHLLRQIFKKVKQRGIKKIRFEEVSETSTRIIAQEAYKLGFGKNFFDSNFWKKFDEYNLIKK